MKKSVLLLAGCAAVLSLASAAHAYTPYVSINAGMAFPEDADSSLDGLDVTLEADPGIALTGALGYEMGVFRLEAELAYQESDIDTLQVHNYGTSTDASGTSSSIAGMVNGYFQFLNHGPFTPFVMAGLGMSKIDLKDFTAMD